MGVLLPALKSLSFFKSIPITYSRSLHQGFECQNGTNYVRRLFSACVSTTDMFAGNLQTISGGWWGHVSYIHVLRMFFANSILTVCNACPCPCILALGCHDTAQHRSFPGSVSHQFWSGGKHVLLNSTCYHSVQEAGDFQRFCRWFHFFAPCSPGWPTGIDCFLPNEESLKAKNVLVLILSYFLSG